LFVVMVFATAAAGAAGAAPSPKTLRTAILKAELAQHSVHYVTTTLRAGATKAGIRARDVADVARDRGIQRWTVSSKSRKLGHIEFLVVHTTAYVRGDTAFVLGWGGFPHLHPGKWYSIPHNSQIYPLVARNVTLGSFARDVVPAHHLSILSSTVRGKTLRSLRGWAPEGGVLTIHLRKGGLPLPVEGAEVERGIEVGLGHVALSDWNEPVLLTAPTHAPPAH
jgi:hypothetical protein